jgi:hypothetical protein
MGEDDELVAVEFAHVEDFHRVSLRRTLAQREVA